MTPEQSAIDFAKAISEAQWAKSELIDVLFHLTQAFSKCCNARGGLDSATSDIAALAMKISHGSNDLEDWLNKYGQQPNDAPTGQDSSAKADSPKVTR